MSIRSLITRGGTTFTAGLGALLVMTSIVSAQITPNGVLDQEAEAVLDINPASGLPDILDGREGVKGAAFFRLDGVRDADIEGSFPDSGPDGFGDAGYSDIQQLVDCKVCLGERAIVRSSLNTGKLIIVYLADTDGVIGQCNAAASNTGDPCTKDTDCPGGTCTIDLGADDSLLYVGFDIFNGNPKDVGNLGGIEDVDFHHIDFVDTFPVGDICQDGVADFDGNGVPDFTGVPFDVDADGDPMFATRWDATPGCQPDDVAELDLSEEQYRTLLYVCAPLLEDLDNDPGTQLPANIGQLFVRAPNGDPQVDAGLSANLVLPAGTSLGDFLESYPSEGDLIANVMGDVEFVVRHVDTLVHAQCGRATIPPVVCTGDFAVDRFQFAQGGVRTMSDADADGSDEDFITATWFAPIPEIEVTKDVRCEGETVWEDDKTVEAMPGSVVEFKIEVENTGNVDLAVCLEDVLEAFVPASVTPVDDSLEVTLYRTGIVNPDPSCNPNDCVVTHQNAPNFDPPLNRDFIGSPFDPGDQGFLDDLDGTCSYLGVLKGVQVCDDPANPTLGDRVVITFEATVDGTFDSCCDPTPTTLDVKNSVTAIGDPDIPPGNTLLPPDNDEARDVHGVIVKDPANNVDTRREKVQKYDDNVVIVDVKCRDIKFDKSVSAWNVDGDALNPNSLPLGDPTQFPIHVKYDYSVLNDGELRETVTIVDKYICADVAAVAGVSFDPALCPVCPPLGVTGTMDPCGGTFSRSCTIKFDSPAALADFLERDDARDDCTANDPIDEPDPLCYKNCAVATVMAADLPEQCNKEDTYADEEIICATHCGIDVIKEVKCDEDTDYAPRVCDDGNPATEGDPCVDKRNCDGGECVSSEPKQDTFARNSGGAGQVLNFRMTVKNIGGSPLEEIALTDDFTCRPWLVSGSFEARALDETGTPIAWPYTTPTPGQLETWFDNDRSRKCFDFEPPMTPGRAVELTFDVRIPADYDEINVDPECENCLTAEGYVEQDSDCQPELDPDDPCWNQDCAKINVLVPDMECQKEVCAEDATGTNHGCASNEVCLTLKEKDITFPLTLTYKFSVENPVTSSDTRLKNVTICDPALCGHAAAYSGTCGLVAGCCFDLNNLAPDDSDFGECTVILSDLAEWEAFAALDGPEDKCYRNMADASADPYLEEKDVEEDICGEHPLDAHCGACVCMTNRVCTCTKAKFDIWNEWEVKFSGTHRCICHWDETLISEYDPPNHMLIEYLHTDKGKARIEGMASSVCPEVLECCEEPRDAPLIGVAAKWIDFGTGTDFPPRAVTGIPMTGMGVEAAQILYTPSPAPDRALGLGAESSGRGDPSQQLTATRPDRLQKPAKAAAEPCEGLSSLTTQKGSVLVYPKVEVKWGPNGNVVQDVFLTMLNDYTEDVTVQLYLILTCDTWVDNTILLTMNEPAYWSAVNGAPKGAISFSSLMPFRVPDTDPRNPGGTVLRGYLLAWAIDPITGSEIHWNHLAGTALTVNYVYGNAWEYSTWAFQAVAEVPGSPEEPEGALLPTPGELNLDGVEYDWAPAVLLLDFYASGTRVSSGGMEIVPIQRIDTDLTLWAAIKDLTEP